jgi:O-acetylserine/cysteine efflux transporter
MPRRHVVAAVVVAVVWGVNFVAIDIGLDHFPPLLFAALRFAVVALALPFVPRPGVPWRYVAGVGLFLCVGQFTLLFIGMAHGMPPGLASLVLQLQAAFTVGLAVALLGERPSRGQLAGGALALAGIGVIAAGRAQSVPLGALALTVGAAASWGAGNIVTRRARSPQPLGMIVYSSAVAPLPLLAMSLLTEDYAGVSVSLGGVLALLYVVILSTLGGYGVWTALLGRYPASSVAPFTLLVPIAGIAAAWAWFGEAPSLAELAGAVLVLCGLALTVGVGRVYATARRRRSGFPRSALTTD